MDIRVTLSVTDPSRPRGKRRRFYNVTVEGCANHTEARRLGLTQIQSQNPGCDVALVQSVEVG